MYHGSTFLLSTFLCHCKYYNHLIRDHKNIKQWIKGTHDEELVLLPSLSHLINVDNSGPGSLAPGLYRKTHTVGVETNCSLIARAWRHSSIIIFQTKLLTTGSILTNPIHRRKKNIMSSHNTKQKDNELILHISQYAYISSNHLQMTKEWDWDISSPG